MKAYFEMGAAQRKVSSGSKPQRGKRERDDKMIDEPIQILLLPRLGVFLRVKIPVKLVPFTTVKWLGNIRIPMIPDRQKHDAFRMAPFSLCCCCFCWEEEEEAEKRKAHHQLS